MTQVEQIIQGLMILQNADPDVKIATATQFIYAYAKLDEVSSTRLEHIGWFITKGSVDSLVVYKAKGSK